MTERSPCGSGGCMTCPFASSEEAETVQNYGCLPDPHSIVKMKEESGHNWACHYDDNKLCGGFANHIRQHRPDLDIREGNLISYTTWDSKGQDVAIHEANTITKVGLDKISKLSIADIDNQIHDAISHGKLSADTTVLDFIKNYLQE